MAAPRVSWLARLKGIDAYPKTIDEFKVRTTQGGFFSVLAFLVIGMLLVSEVSYYFGVDTVDRMLVDGKRNVEVPIHFDITFPMMPCSIVAVESSDLAGTVHRDIVNNIQKLSLDKDGRPFKASTDEQMGGALTNDTHLSKAVVDKPACGSCYAAGDPGQCCNTCEEVKDAYIRKSWKIPSLHTIAQCQVEEIERVLRGDVQEGCQIRGFLQVGKVEGRVYFAPSKFLQSGYLSPQDLLESTFRVFDTSHRISSLSFGAAYPSMTNPLDNHEQKLNDTKRGTFQYFLKVVPTEYRFLNGQRMDTNQFSVTANFRELTPLSEKGLPMVSFAYSFSPIMFRIEQVRKGLLQFLTSVCAIVGGIFTIMGLFDALAFALQTKTSRASLGL